MKQVAIIGGGISGLSAAWELKKKNIPFILFEATDQCGGAIRTLHEAGCLIETGPNSLSGPHPELDRLIDELDLATEVCPADPQASNRFIVRDGQPIALPRSITEFIHTPLFSTAAKWRLLKEPFIRSQTFPGETLAAFAERRLGKEPLTYALNPFVSGIYAGDPDRLSAAAAFPTLIEMEREHGSLLKAMIHRSKKQRISGKPRSPRTIYTFKAGMQTLPNRLAEKIGTDAIKTHHPIEHIETLSTGEWKIAGDLFSDLLLTLPTHVQSQLATPFDLSFFDSIRYPAVTSLSLLYDRNQLTHPLNGFGMLIPACENRFILGVLFPSSIFPNRAPKNKILLTVFIGGDRAPDRALLPIDQLLPQVEKDLQELLGLQGAPHHITARCWTDAIPQYTAKIESVHRQLTTLEAAHSGLYFAGNYRHGISITNAITSGRNAAERIIENQSAGKESGATPTLDEEKNV